MINSSIKNAVIIAVVYSIKKGAKSALYKYSEMYVKQKNSLRNRRNGWHLDCGN